MSDQLDNGMGIPGTFQYINGRSTLGDRKTGENHNVRFQKGVSRGEVGNAI